MGIHIYLDDLNQIIKPSLASKPEKFSQNIKDLEISSIFYYILFFNL